ncbi:MAG: hypothetical protein AAGA74_19340 [Pseudomonadota bacterium]
MTPFERFLGLVAAILTILGFVLSLLVSSPDYLPNIQLTSDELQITGSYTATVFFVLLTSVIAAFVFTRSLDLFVRTLGPMSFASTSLVIGFISGFQTSVLNSLFFPVWSSSMPLTAVFICFCSFSIFLETIYLSLSENDPTKPKPDTSKDVLGNAIFFSVAVALFVVDLKPIDDVSTIVATFAVSGFFGVIAVFGAGFLLEQLGL